MRFVAAVLAFSVLLTLSAARRLVSRPNGPALPQLANLEAPFCVHLRGGLRSWPFQRRPLEAKRDSDPDRSQRD